MPGPTRVGCQGRVKGPRDGLTIRVIDHYKRVALVDDVLQGVNRAKGGQFYVPSGSIGVRESSSPTIQGRGEESPNRNLATQLKLRSVVLGRGVATLDFPSVVSIH